MPQIAATAFVDPAATLADDVVVGHHCFVGPDVTLGAGCRLHNNVTITGWTTAGRANEFFPCCVIGEVPQDLKYRGERTKLVIGDHNLFREHVTAHPGTELGGAVTRIGNRNVFLVGVHIAHDVQLGDNIVASNMAQIAGHVVIEDRVHLGGLAGVHPFVTIGRLGFLAGLSRAVRDVPPFTIVAGERGEVRGVNAEGMSRWGHSEAEVQAMRDAYRKLFGRRRNADGDNLSETIAEMESNGHADPNVRYLLEFLKRNIAHGRHGRWRESLRSDTDDDRKRYYRPAEGASPS